MTITVVTQSVIKSRIRAVLPAGWFPDTTPILDGVLNGPAYAWAWLNAMVAFVGLQARRATASGIFLDLISADFFGTFLKRRTNESDALFSTRIGKEMFREKGTRAGMIAALTDLTGRTPIVCEPAYPFCTGGYGVARGYSTAGAYGSMALPFQYFITAFRPLGVGVANVSGYGDIGSGPTGLPGGYGVGSVEYANPTMFVPPVSDQDILNTINDVKPVATIAWTNISS